MANTVIEGRTVRIARPSEVLYSVFSDLTNFTRNLPPEITSKADLQATPNNIIAKVQGFELGMEVTERRPFNKVRYSQYGSTPINFDLTVNLQEISTSTTQFQLTLETELSGMYKMMLGGKLQEVVDKITDQLENTMGVFPAQ